MMLKARLAAVAVPLLAACSGTRAAFTAPVEVEIPEALPAPPAETATAKPAPASARFLGRWEGVGHQESGSSWPMVVDLETLDEGVCAHVRYPSVPCAAEWLCSGKFDGRTLRARERLTEGKDACIDDGEMQMSLDGAGRLAWRWVGGGDKAAASLRRTGDVAVPAAGR